MGEQFSRFANGPTWAEFASLMKRLFRTLHWAARTRYWRSRAVKAEAQIKAQSAQLQAEQWRNREREDYFVSAAVMGGRGMVGITARSGPAGAQSPTRPTTDPWQSLRAIDRMEFETQWLPDALVNNVSETAARARFLQELASRRAMNDGGVM